MHTITRAQLKKIAGSYPAELQPYALSDIRRQIFQVNLVSRLAPGGAVADLGGGVAMFSPGAAELGMQAILIDDFADPNNDQHGDRALGPHHERGVEIYARDVINEGLGLPPETLDVAISVDTMEHFHHSPKRLFHETMTALKPGGWFVLGVPNCVHLRRRITVPLGRGKWSSLDDWYEKQVFRGHVREADVDDLQYIAHDIGLTEVRILGKNWLGYKSARPWVRRAIPLADRLMQHWPALCSDLYLVGRKPLHTRSVGVQGSAEVR